MSFLHKDMTQEKWNKLSKEDQVLNIASEMTRLRNWLKKEEAEYVHQSLGRVLELTDLTVCDSRWNKNSRRELLRWREQAGILYASAGQLDADMLLRCLLNFFPKTSVCNT